MKQYIEIDLGDGLPSPHWPINQVSSREELIELVTRDSELIFNGHDKKKVRTAKINLISVVSNDDWSITPICTINNNLNYGR